MIAVVHSKLCKWPSDPELAHMMSGADCEDCVNVARRMLLCAQRVHNINGSFHRFPPLATRWPRKYCQVCKKIRSLGLQVCLRCTLTVAACQCPAKIANAATMNVVDNETTEGPGFVSQAFRNNLALLETWVAAHAGELPLRHGKRDNETKLSEWIHRIRKAHKARCLNLTQLDLLKSIPSISIEHADAAWEKTCVELRSWLEKHHRTNEDGSNTWQYPRQHAEDTTERKLAAWLNNKRHWQKEAAPVKANFNVGVRE